MTTIETTEITNSEDIIDVRDVIARFESLTDEIDDVKNGESIQAEAMSIGEWIDTLDLAKHPFADAIQEYQTLYALLDDLRGNGGDEQWKGDWYPVTLIRDSYFDESYAENEAEECGMIVQNATWPNCCIDWTKALEMLQMDYSTVDFDGETYWYR